MNFIELLSKLIEKLSIKQLMISLSIVIVFTFVPKINFLDDIVLLSQNVQSIDDINIPMFLASLIVVFVIIEFIQWLYFLFIKLKGNYKKNREIYDLNQKTEANFISEINSQNDIVKGILKALVLENKGYMAVPIPHYKIQEIIDYMQRRNWINIVPNSQMDISYNKYTINITISQSKLNEFKKLYDRKLILQDVDLDDIDS